MQAKLTNRESQIFKLNAIGLTPDEISDKLKIASNTVRKNIDNIKKKLNLQKATELAAYYWCEFFGSSLDEQKKKIGTLIMLLMFQTTFVHDDFRRMRMPIRFRSRTEYSISI